MKKKTCGNCGNYGTANGLGNYFWCGWHECFIAKSLKHEETECLGWKKPKKTSKK